MDVQEFWCSSCYMIVFNSYTTFCLSWSLFYSTPFHLFTSNFRSSPWACTWQMILYRHSHQYPSSCTLPQTQSVVLFADGINSFQSTSQIEAFFRLIFCLSFDRSEKLRGLILPRSFEISRTFACGCWTGLNTQI